MNPVEACDPREMLVVDALLRGSRVRVQVRGESMLPTLWPGDTVEIAAGGPPRSKPGDIVLALHDHRLFLHRLLLVSEDGGMVTRGDSMPQSDPPGQQCLGRVERAFRSGRPGLIPLRLSLWSRLAGRLLCRCDWIRRLALAIHQKRIAATGGPAVPGLA